MIINIISPVIPLYGNLLHPVVGLTKLGDVDDPYEPLQYAEITLDTVAHTPEENAYVIFVYMVDRGFVRRPAMNGSGPKLTSKNPYSFRSII